MYFTTTNQFVLLNLMIGKYYQLAFEKEKKKIEAEAYEISGKNPLRKGFSFRFLKLCSSTKGVELSVC